MTSLQVYENEGFELNEPDYKFGNLEFVGTCGSFPEQYDIVYNTGTIRYQVGYFRLRGGRSSATVPDVLGTEVYCKMHDNPRKGEFSSEKERLSTLTLVANAINKYYRREHEPIFWT